MGRILFAVGCCRRWGAFITEAVWGWTGIAPATFLQFGSAFFIAAILFFVERRFLREARSETRALEQRLEARTSKLESRLDRLTDATAEAVKQRRSMQDANLARLTEDVSFDTVTSALAEARRLDATDPFLFRVKTSVRLDGLRAEFAWVDWESSDGTSQREFEIELASPDPETAAVLSRRRVTWMPDEPAPAVGNAVVLMLEREGLFKGPETFDWGFTIRELQKSLELAIGARRGDVGGVHLQGRLVELVDDDWMLTDAGIECPGRSFLLSQGAFPARPKFPPFPLDDGPHPTAFDPPAPAWVSADMWGQLLGLARLIYPIEPRSTLHDPGWRWRGVTSATAGSGDGGVRGTPE